ncbi:hypothetical protein ACHAWO_006402 [Cyclotella atomus]|uniref:Uncharacterized protein n=1 Tax=Cyclotella atomus TaxID=382360 RepID=A0ABD3MQY9_9STRA
MEESPTPSQSTLILKSATGRWNFLSCMCHILMQCLSKITRGSLDGRAAGGIGGKASPSSTSSSGIPGLFLARSNADLDRAIQ